jgi:beta-N-acetylhexosaminidase
VFERLRAKIFTVALFRLLVLAILCSPLIGPEFCSATSTNGEVDSKQEALSPEYLLKQMTLDQKIGQLFLLGFKGQRYDGEMRSVLRTIRPGGILVFRRNIKSAEQVAKMNQSTQLDFLDNNLVPVFIAIDQEGGLVTRIKSRPPLPSALALGQTNSRDIVGRMGFYTGSLMRSLGFNMNLAPVIDVADPNQPSFIGTRAFSGDPEAVGRMAYAFAQGLEMAGVVATLKHYPGHGGKTADSHKQIPIMKDDLNTLLSSSLKPFSYLTSNLDVPAIMVAHVMYPNIDNSPATYSKVLVDEVLRKKLGYNGLIVTDDIEMAGAKNIKDPGEQAVRAVQAGVDMIMVAWHKGAQLKAFNSLKRAVIQKKIPLARIESSVLRILGIKLKYGLFHRPAAPSLKTINTVFSDPSFRKAVDQVMLSNVERSFQNVIMDRPFPEDRQIGVFSLSEKFYDSFRESAKACQCKHFVFSTSEKLRRDIEGLGDGLALVYISGRKTLSLVNSLPRQLASKVLVINTSIPGAISRPDHFVGVVNIYSPHAAAGQFIAKHMFSEADPEIRGPASTDEIPDESVTEQDSDHVSKNLSRINKNYGGKQPRSY